MKYAILALLFFILVASSCRKEQTQVEVKKVSGKNFFDFTAKLPGELSGTLPTYEVFFNSITQTYQTGFAGGLDFGGQFTHPANKYDFQEYTPWTPAIAGVSGPPHFMEYKPDGNRFMVILGKLARGLIYRYDFRRYLDSLDKGYLPNIDDFISRAGVDQSNDTFTLILSGQFIIDYNSPTGVAVADLKTKLPDSTRNLLPRLVLDQINNEGNSYDVSIYELIKKVHQIKAGSLPDNHPKQVFLFDADYEKINDISIRVSGKIVTNEHKTFEFDEVLML